MALLKPSAEQVYDLIALTNAAIWPQGQVALEYGVPAVLTGHPSGKDTSLDVTAAENTVYVGTVPVYYNRLDLAGFATAYGEADLVVGVDPTVEDIVTQFNTFYDASLAADDYVPNAPVPGQEYEGEDFPDYDGEIYTLVAAAGSLAYKGQAALKIRLESQQLSSIIVIQELEGLEFPEAG